MSTREIPARRTQQQRRSATISKLIDGTILALIEVGYAHASVLEICRRAGVSHGGLFRHFETRLDLVAAAAEEVSRQQVEQFKKQLAAASRSRAPLEAAIRTMRDVARAPKSGVWYELLAAARTDDELRRRLERIARHQYEQIRSVAVQLPGIDAFDPDRLELVLRLLLNNFISEAVLSVVVPEPDREDRLLEFVTRLVLDDALT
jgi:AcrR family transcriptional regulator